MKHRRSTMWMLLTFVIILVLHNIFDIGKWAIGRYTDIGTLLSIAIMLVFSAVFTVVMEVLHRWRTRKERQYIRYSHHGIEVWVRGDLKGKHWDPAICMDCARFKPDTPENCVITRKAFELCKEHHLVVVMWECPEFEPREGRAEEPTSPETICDTCALDPGRAVVCPHEDPEGYNCGMWRHKELEP